MTRSPLVEIQLVMEPLKLSVWSLVLKSLALVPASVLMPRMSMVAVALVAGGT